MVRKILRAARENPAPMIAFGLVAGITVLAAYLRFFQLDESFWFDEILMYRAAKLPFREALSHRSYFLCYILAHWAVQYGDSEYMLRLPNAIAGILSVPAIYFLGKEAHSRPAGIVSALLLATSTYNIRYSQEARYYGIVMFMGILLCWMAHRYVIRGGYVNGHAFFAVCWLNAVTQFTVVVYVPATATGAWLWLAMTKSQITLRQRIVRMVVVALCAGLGLSGLFVFMFLLKDSTLNMMNLANVGVSNLGTNLEADSDEAHEYNFQLTPSELVQFYVTYFSLKNGLPRYSLAAFAVVGIAALMKSRPAMAAIVGSQLLLAPVPYLIMSAEHYYNAKYFSTVMPICVMLGAIGIVVIAAAASHVTIEGMRRFGIQGSFREWRPALTTTLVLVVLAPFVVWTQDSLARYYHSRPYADWKNLVATLVDRIRPNDVIAYTTPAELDRPNPINSDAYIGMQMPCEFYLEREARLKYPEGYEALLQSIEHADAFLPSAILELPNRYPTRRIWHVTLNEREQHPEYAEAIESLNARGRQRFHKLTLRMVRPNAVVKRLGAGS